ncbi:MAG: hypothetical protein WC055_11990 [Melioribacteraceae bacterium]
MFKNDAEFIKDANERGLKLDANRWAKYKKNKSGQITDDTLIWVTIRLGIDIHIRCGNPVFDGKKIDWVINKYDELKCVTAIQQTYPKK